MYYSLQIYIGPGQTTQDRPEFKFTSHQYADSVFKSNMSCMSLNQPKVHYKHNRQTHKHLEEIPLTVVCKASGCLPKIRSFRRLTAKTGRCQVRIGLALYPGY